MATRPSPHAFASTRKTFQTASGKTGELYSLPALARKFPNIKRLPVSIRVVLESVLRHCDGQRVTPEHVAQLANWRPNARAPARDSLCRRPRGAAGLYRRALLADLAAMRDAAAAQGHDPANASNRRCRSIWSSITRSPSITTAADSLDLNMKLEFQRNRERYEFMKWGMRPSGPSASCHPAPASCIRSISNIWRVACTSRARRRGVSRYPGRHRQPYDDDQWHRRRRLGRRRHRSGGGDAWPAGVFADARRGRGRADADGCARACTSTDLVLTLTQMLRKARVVGKFVEFFGEGTTSLSVPDRATIANMAPEYGATMGYFPVDEKTVEYLEGTGRSKPPRSRCSRRISGRRPVRRAGRPARSTIRRWWPWTWRRSHPRWPARSDRRTASRSARWPRASALFSAPMAENGFNRPTAELRSRGARRCPTADRRRRPCRARSGRRWSRHGRGRRGGALGDCADRAPSPAAPTPATRACCWPPACWPRRRSQAG
jgi:aconitate hydratase